MTFGRARSTPGEMWAEVAGVDHGVMSGIQSEIPALPVLVTLTAALLLVTWWRYRHRLLLAWAWVGYAMAVLAVTLLPLQIATGDYANQVPWYETGNWLPVVTIDAVTFVANIVMFVPLGVLLAMAGRTRTPRQAALIALACSAGIEIVQYLTNVLVSSGRTADVNDLIANTLGAVLGFLAWRAISVRLITAT
jgi:glycopeptide antibiotics resistance protein